MKYRIILPILSMIFTGTVIAGDNLNPNNKCIDNVDCDLKKDVYVTLMPVQMTPSHRSFCMALKTNMLYDGLLVPNLGVEFHISRGWSVGANWMYAWWKSDKRHNYWHIYGGELDVRKYMGRRAETLSGHHVGVYSQLLTYDFEKGGNGYMAGTPDGTLWDKANYAVGLEYGYSHPVGRRLNIDFTLGVGYMGGLYHKYQPVDECYVWQYTKRRRWFGPTKAEVSLVWLIGRNVCN